MSGSRNQPPARSFPTEVAARYRVRFAKRGPLRFTSHRDVARAFERAVRRGGVPITWSSGFTPHPRLSWAGAAPTGVASEAEYVEMGLAVDVEPERLRVALDDALPHGLDVLHVARSRPGALADLLEASEWLLRLDGVEPAAARAAVASFLAVERLGVEKRTKSGLKEVDVRGPVVALEVLEGVPGDDATGAAGTPARAPAQGAGRGAPGEPGGADVPRAILRLVVRQVTPAVRPDDVLAGLRAVADLDGSSPLVATRLAQGALRADGGIADPLAPDPDAAPAGVGAAADPPPGP